MEAKSVHEVAGAEVVAVGPGTAQRPAAAAFLGHLFWYSISEAHAPRGELLSAMEDAGLEERFAPGEISARDAFRRVTSSLEVRKVALDAAANGRLFGTERRHANLLVRDVRSGGGAPVRQVVREVVDAVGVALDHRVVAQLELSGDRINAFPLSSSLLPEERDLLDRAEDAFAFAKEHHDAGAVRRVVSCALAECSPVGLRASGGVYFVPREREPELRAIGRFIEEMKDRLGEAARRTIAMTVPLVDKEEYRDAIAASLDEQVEREANALIREMAEVLRSGKKITRRRHDDFFARVRALKGSVSEYEALLERDITDAKANLELAQREAVALLTRVEVK